MPNIRELKTLRDLRETTINSRFEKLQEMDFRGTKALDKMH